MRNNSPSERLVREEGGFTLPEMLVTITIMIVVLFALYNIFDMSIRVFRFGNDKIEAVENARLGLEKMEREIRAAYPVDKSDPTKGYLFFSANGSSSNPPRATPSATQITFGNELGTRNGKIECGNPCEYITYKLDGTTLRRINVASSASTGDPMVESVDANGLNFTYLGSNGNPCGGSNPTCSGTDEGQIFSVRITLNIRVEGGQQDGTQTLTTDVDLRNRE